MMHFSSNLLVAVFGIVAVMAIGGLLPFWLPGVRRHLPLALAGAAGIMLGTAMLHLYPEAHEILHERAGFALLTGFVALYLFERFITVHICETFGCHVHHIGISALFGLSIHTFANGVALGTGLVAGMGGIVFFAIAAHKLPEAFSLTAILMHERYRRVHIVAMNCLFMAMIPLGALAMRAAIAAPTTATAGWALGFSAGTFLHIALSDLLPEVHKTAEGRVAKSLAFLLGLVLVAVFNTHE